MYFTVATSFRNKRVLYQSAFSNRIMLHEAYKNWVVPSQPRAVELEIQHNLGKKMSYASCSFQSRAENK